MSNTIDTANLVTDHLANAVISVGNRALAPVGLFARQFETDPLKALAVVQVPKVTVGATGQQDATDFEDGDSTVDAIPVTVHQESLSWHVSNADLLNGIRLQQLAEINTLNFCIQLIDRVCAVMSTANFGDPINIGSAALFDASALAPVRSRAKNYTAKNLLLDGGHLAYLAPALTTNLDWRNTGAFGFDRIAEHNRFDAAATNAVGFVCGPNAIAIAAGISELPGSMSARTLMLDIGIAVRLASWVNLRYRTWWMALDCMFGAAAGDTDQGEILTNA